MKESIQQQVWTMFHNQLKDWSLPAKNFEALSQVKVKRIPFKDYDVLVQYNPARMVSSGAKIDQASIAKRACFLCEANRPKEQEGVAWGDYTILINPFPIFPEHFTIPRSHEPQALLPYFDDMLGLAADLPDLLVFYNGPRCGASAPDHMHFQAGTKTYLPLVTDYERLRCLSTHFKMEGVDCFEMPASYGRTIIGLQGTDRKTLGEAFKTIYTYLQGDGQEEPLMNVVCWIDQQRQRWQVIIIPRGAFRPIQYGTGMAPELLVSPATVEMGGIFITPILEHFERITSEDIQDIFGQVTYKL